MVSRGGSSTFAIPAWLVQAAPSLPNSHIPTLLPGPGPVSGAGWGSTGPLQLIQPFLRLALAKAGGRDGEGGPLLQSAHNQEEAGSQVTPQASSCRDGFEGCGVISPGWSRLSGKTSWRSSGGLGPQTGNLTAGLRHRCKAAGRWQLQVGLLLWQRTGSWETRVLGPQGGRETSSEATEKPKRGRPEGSPGDFSEPAGGLPSASVECFCPLAAISHPGRAESGGTGGAGRMVVTACHSGPVTLPSTLCVMPSAVTLLGV